MIPKQPIPAFYINLASRPDRRAFMEEQFDRLGMVVERIEATTKDQVPEERMAPHRAPRNRNAMSQVEVASVLSHEHAWRNFLETGAEHALILEDDIVMSEGMPHFLDPSLHKDMGVDIMKLETFRRKVHLGRVRRTVEGRWAVRQLLSSHMGAAAYVISRTRAQRTLTDPLARTMTVDRYLFDKRGPVLPAKGIFQVEPAPSVQMHLHAGSTASDVARSDLAVGRSNSGAGRRDRAGMGPQEAFARARYKLRTILETFQDLEAITSRRRMVGFADD